MGHKKYREVGFGPYLFPPSTRCAAALLRWNASHMVHHLEELAPPSRYVCADKPRNYTAVPSRLMPNPSPARSAAAAEDDVVNGASWSRPLRDALNGNGTLWFLGDSTTELHFLATMCRLGAEMDPEKAAPSLGNAQNAFCLRVDRGPLVDLRGCWREVKMTKSMDESIADPYWRRVLDDTYAHAQAADVIIANLGLFYHKSPELPKPDIILRRDVMALQRAQRNALPALRPLLLWRETVAESFPTTTGGLSSWLMRTTDSKWRCMMAPAHHNPYNAVTNPLMKAANITILRIHEVSRLGWQDLRGYHHALDCVHHCLPSGVLDYWVDDLIDTVLNARIGPGWRSTNLQTL